MGSGDGEHSGLCQGDSICKHTVIILTPFHKHFLDHFNWASFRRSSHFFISGNNPIAKLPEYLETMLGKMAKEMPGINTKQEVLGSQDEEVVFLQSFYKQE